MAKLKVHELAKELDKQSKEIIAFLQDKGIEVKAAQSSLEEDAVALVRNAFGQGNTGESKKAPIMEETTQRTEKTPAKEAIESVSVKETAEAEGKASPNKEEAPKKKKKIIFVSNPHNSNIPGQRQNNGERKPGQGQKQGNRPQQQGNVNRQGQGKEVPHKIIRPLTAPSVPETTRPDFKQNAKRMENERIAAKNAAIKKEAEEKAAAEAAKQQTKQAPVRNESPVKEERYQKNERTHKCRKQPGRKTCKK